MGDAVRGLGNETRRPGSNDQAASSDEKLKPDLTATSRQSHPGLANAPDPAEPGNETSRRSTKISAAGISAGAASADPAAAEKTAGARVTPSPLETIKTLVRAQVRSGERFERMLGDIETHSGLMAKPMNRAAAMAVLLEKLELASDVDTAGPPTNPRYQSYTRIRKASVAEMNGSTTDDLAAALLHVRSLVRSARKNLKPGEQAAIILPEVIGLDEASLAKRTKDLEAVLTAIETRSDVLALPGDRATMVLNFLKNLERIPNPDGAEPMSNPRYRCYQQLAKIMHKEAELTDSQHPDAMPEGHVSALTAFMRNLGQQLLTADELAAIENGKYGHAS